MKNYEITFITKEDQKDKPVKTILENLGGKILSVSSIGQKTFAYPIKKEKAGFYTTVNFEIESEKVIDLNKKLALEEDILRFLIIAVTHTAQMAQLPTKTKETEIIPEPEKELIPEPEKEIIVETIKEEKIEKPKKIAKPKVKPAEKPTGQSPLGGAKKVSKAVEELTESLAEPVSESERLDALDKKLEELLKE